MIIKYKKYLALVVLFSMLFPQISYAVHPAIAAIGALLAGIGGKLEEVFEPVVVQLLSATLILGLSMFVLMFAVSTLELVIENQTVFLEQLLPVTRAAFDFVVGLANMFVILILVVIAFAFILKIESFQAKKTLPRLIIVALLLNFSLLFVNMLIDLSQIIYNTILAAGGIELLLEVFGIIISRTMNLLLGMYITVTALLALMGAPKIATAIIALVGFIAPVVIIPMLIFVLFMAGFAFMLAAPIALLAFLFAARIFVLQLLGVVAPLAFLCLILPQTKKHFDEWFGHLVQWLTLGIAALFLLSIGFGIIGFLQADVDVGFTNLLKISVLPIRALFTWQNPIRLLFELHGPMYVYFFALFVYMCIVIFFIRRTMPAIANVLIEQGKGLAGMLWTTGIKPFTKAAWRQTQKTAAESEEVQALASRMAMAKTPELRGWKKIATPFVATHYGLTRAIGRQFGPGAIEAQRGEIDEAEKKVAGKRIETQMAAWADARTDRARIGILNAMSKDQNIDDAMDRARFGANAIPQAEIARLYPIAQNRYDKHSTLRSAFPDIAAANPPPQPAGAPPPPPPPPGITPAQHQAQQVLARIRPSDYENMSRRVIGDPTRRVAGDNEFLEAMLRRGTEEQVSALRRRFGMDAALALETRLQDLATAQGITPRQLLQNLNPRLYRYFTRGPGQGQINI